MENISKFSKILLSLTCIFGALWLGSYLSRNLVFYQFFEPDGLQLRNYYSDSNLPTVFRTVLPLFVTNLITYLLFLVSFVLFVALSKINFKENGWYLIIALAIFILAPFEIFLSIKDFKIIQAIQANNQNPLDIIEKIKERMILLNGFSIIHILSVSMTVFLFVFKPLKK